MSRTRGKPFISDAGRGKEIPQKLGASVANATPYTGPSFRMPNCPRIRALTSSSSTRLRSVIACSSDTALLRTMLAPCRLTISVREDSVKRVPARSVAVTSSGMLSMTRSLRRLPAPAASGPDASVAGAAAAPPPVPTEDTAFLIGSSDMWRFLNSVAAAIRRITGDSP